MPFDISFESGGHILKGKFFQAENSGPGTTLILLYGFPGNDRDPMGLGKRISASRVNVLAFNYSGTFQSEGEFGLEQTFTDIQAAWNYVHRSDIVTRFQIDTARIVLGGHSYGGGMALAYAARHPEVRRLISIAGNDHGEFAREYTRNTAMARSLDSSFETLKRPAGPVSFQGSAVLKQLAANPASVDLRLAAAQLADRDLLLVGGWDDQQVTIEQNMLPVYRALKKAGANSVRFVAMQTDHSFGNVREELAKVLIQWLVPTSRGMTGPD